ncbi:MAG TPA: hypothetical protein VKA74_06580 [Myxococcota bacterium]|nr:hypothetical protein [Myxococcota bacterium]
MEKLVYVLWGSKIPVSDRLEKIGRPLISVAREAGASTMSLLLPDQTELIRERSPARLSPSFDSASLVFQCWLPSLDVRAPIETALGRQDGELWGYLVTESTVQPRPGSEAEAERLPGITQITLNEKPEGVSDEAFYHEWQVVHSRMSFDLHPLRESYERNAVARRLTPEAPDHRAIVLERFSTLEDFVDESRYFGDPEVVKATFAHVPTFYRFDTAITGGMSELRFR